MEKQRLVTIALVISMFIAGLLVGGLGEGLFEEEEENGRTIKGVEFNDPYSPTIDPADFVDVVDNPYYPLAVGSEWTYEGQTEDGLEHIDFRVLNETRVVMGVTCTVVRDTVTVDGELVEDTYDWFAQDVNGNVWYFGEDSTDYEDGKAVSTHGSWESGVGGAYPGIIMLGDPYDGLTYRQEYLKGEAEDMATVLSLDGTVTAGGITYTEVLKTRDFTPLDPKNFAYKYYAPGVGVVLEEEGGERVELEELVQP
jgi:hypothetical protein